MKQVAGWSPVAAEAYDPAPHYGTFMDSNGILPSLSISVIGMRIWRGWKDKIEGLEKDISF